MAAAPGPLAYPSRSVGPLACPSRSARPRNARVPNLTLNIYTNLLNKEMVMYKIDRRGGAGVQKSFSRTDPSRIDQRVKFLEFYNKFY